MAADQGTVSFKLADNIDGASAALGDGTFYDIAAAAAAGGGTITTGDEHLIVILRSHHGVVEVSDAPKAASKSKTSTTKEG
jgi:hypothetical protein